MRMGVVDANIATPVLQFVKGTANTVQGVAAVTCKLSTHQELHIFMESASWDLSSQVLPTFWLTWVTQGFWAGSRRVILNTQVHALDRMSRFLFVCVCVCAYVDLC